MKIRKLFERLKMLMFNYLINSEMDRMKREKIK
jgi:hypothetical protein